MNVILHIEGDQRAFIIITIFSYFRNRIQNNRETELQENYVVLCERTQ